MYLQPWKDSSGRQSNLYALSLPSRKAIYNGVEVLKPSKASEIFGMNSTGPAIVFKPNSGATEPLLVALSYTIAEVEAQQKIHRWSRISRTFL